MGDNARDQTDVGQTTRPSPPFVYLPVCVVSIDGYIYWRWPDSWS